MLRVSPASFRLRGPGKAKGPPWGMWPLPKNSQAATNLPSSAGWTRASQSPSPASLSPTRMRTTWTRTTWTRTTRRPSPRECRTASQGAQQRQTEHRQVLEYYDRHSEWDRLAEGRGRLEFLRTTEIVLRNLP